MNVRNICSIDNKIEPVLQYCNGKIKLMMVLLQQFYFEHFTTLSTSGYMHMLVLGSECHLHGISKYFDVTAYIHMYTIHTCTHTHTSYIYMNKFIKTPPHPHPHAVNVKHKYGP